MSWALVVVLLASAFVVAESNAEKAAIQSANEWLALADAGNSAATWDSAAPLFKNAVTKQQWAQALNAARGPLGKVESRKLKSATYAISLPGAPDGQYVVIQFDSSFEHKRNAVETVTPMLDKDGKWKVSGYYIR